MKVVLIDDERLARAELRRLLAGHPDVSIEGEARNAGEAVELVRSVQPDLMFLDIEMPGGSGFDVLEQLESVPQVIFTTAFDQYAIQAFEVNALDYLLKPIAPERLASALERAKPRAPVKPLSQVFVRDGERCWIVKVPEIVLLESEGNYTRLHFGKERPLIRRSLNALEQQLESGMFFRANRQQIINMEWIEGAEIGVAGGLTVTLRGGTVVEMSRGQSDKLREILSL